MPQLEMLLRSIAGDFMKRDDVKATNPKKISPRCEEFRVESIYQIQKRFDLDAEVHDIVQCTLPQSAASTIPPSPEIICKKLPYLKEILNTEKFDHEWANGANTQRMMKLMVTLVGKNTVPPSEM